LKNLPRACRNFDFIEEDSPSAVEEMRRRFIGTSFHIRATLAGSGRSSLHPIATIEAIISR
jgi:hypothetical protein